MPADLQLNFLPWRLD